MKHKEKEKFRKLFLQNQFSNTQISKMINVSRITVNVWTNELMKCKTGQLKYLLFSKIYPNPNISIVEYAFLLNTTEFSIGRYIRKYEKLQQSNPK